MIQSLISLLKSKEVQIIITQGLKLAASPNVAKLMQGVTKCAKSIFYIIKTPEITRFQTEIMELIEDENKKQKEEATDTRIPGMDPIEEGYSNEDVQQQQQQQECKEQNDDHDTPKSPENTATTATESGYYSPYKAWTGLTSIFGGYDQESDASDENNVNEEEEQKEAVPVGGVNLNRGQRSQSVAAINANSNQLEPQSRRTLSFDQSMPQSQGVESSFNPNASRRNSVSLNGFNNFNCVQSAERSGGVDDWVDLVLYIDELEDNADISIAEGEELRQLALKQMEKLLIVYKCYYRKQSRFMRYARGILKAEEEARILEEEKEALLMEKERMCMQSIPLSPEKEESSENYSNANVDDNLICID